MTEEPRDGHWRRAIAEEDDDIVAMCEALYTEDPSALTVTPPQTRRTLAALRAEPWRGRAVVAECDGKVAGYALLISFWSNELGGSICDVDELFVRPAFRRRGFGSSLFRAIERRTIWDEPCVGMALIVTDGNQRARSLYQRIGFKPSGTTLLRGFAT
jgi:GNAT superfamily N-acetyltransferase